MSKFIKFYEWLCDAMVPLMIVGLMFFSIIFYKAVIAGQALEDRDVIIGLGSLGFDYAVFFTWLICSLIRRHQLKREV